MITDPIRPPLGLAPTTGSAAELRAKIIELEAEVKRLKRFARCPREPKPGVGGVIQMLRQNQGVSLSELAAASGISKGNISKIETEDHPNPRLGTLECLARTLGHKVSVVIAMAEDGSPQSDQDQAQPPTTKK